MLYASFPRQSSAADWDETIELTDEETGDVLWTTLPADLLLTLTVIPEKESTSSDYGSITTAQNAVISATSDDGSGIIAAVANGVVSIFVDEATMAELAPDKYGVDRRFLVFIKITHTDTDETTQGPVGILPVYRGH